MSDEYIELLGLRCPSGGDFYICSGDSKEFIGCCTTNPCDEGLGVCPQSNLRASSFDSGRYASIPEQDCLDDRGKIFWYTCRDNNPPFIGCCAIVPCGEGCPKEHLIMALLSTDEENRRAFADAPLQPIEPANNFLIPPTVPSTVSGSQPLEGSIFTDGLLIGIAVGGTIVLVVAGILLGGYRRRIWKTVPKRLSPDMVDLPYQHSSKSKGPKFTPSRLT